MLPDVPEAGVPLIVRSVGRTLMFPLIGIVIRNGRPEHLGFVRRHEFAGQILHRQHRRLRVLLVDQAYVVDAERAVEDKEADGIGQRAAPVGPARRKRRTHIIDDHGIAVHQEIVLPVRISVAYVQNHMVPYACVFGVCQLGWDGRPGGRAPIAMQNGNIGIGRLIEQVEFEGYVVCEERVRQLASKLGESGFQALDAQVTVRHSGHRPVLVLVPPAVRQPGFIRIEPVLEQDAPLVLDAVRDRMRFAARIVRQPHVPVTACIHHDRRAHDLQARAGDADRDDLCVVVRRVKSHVRFPCVGCVPWIDVHRPVHVVAGHQAVRRQIDDHAHLAASAQDPGIRREDHGIEVDVAGVVLEFEPHLVRLALQPLQHAVADG